MIIEFAGYVVQALNLSHLMFVHVLHYIYQWNFILQASAKESRKRKMDYVDGLEKRVKLSTTENNQLKKKVEGLEKQNM